VKHLMVTLLLASCAGVGCVSLPKLWEKPKPPAPAVQTPIPNPPVTAAQINERNAGQMAGTLAHEVDRESTGNGIQQAGYNSTSIETTPCKH
jgi:hypothetical protein